MSDPILEYMKQQGLGTVERRVPFAETMPLEGHDGDAGAALVQTDQGVWVVAAVEGPRGTDIDLAGGGFRFEPGTLRTRLVIGERSFTVAFPHAADARCAIGVGRHRSRARASLSALGPFGRHVDALSEIEQAWLDAELAPGEVLLVWLQTGTSVTIPSDVLDEAKGTLHLLITDRRQSLCALSALGDVSVLPLPPEPLEIQPGSGAAAVASAARPFETSRASTARFREVAGLPALAAEERIMSVARLCFRAGGPQDRAAARRLLDAATARDHGLAHAVAQMFTVRDQNLSVPVKPGLIVDALRAADAPPDALAKLWEDWGLKSEGGHALLDALRPLGEAAEPWALSLHRHLHALPPRGKAEKAAQARNDIRLAEHLLAVGQPEEARALLEARVTKLPDEKRSELLPPKDANLTAGDGGQALRIRVFELLADARGAGGDRDREALSELASLNPLVIDRVRALGDVEDPSLRRRAWDVIQVLSRVESGEVTAAGMAPLRGLSERLVEEVLPHPLSREEGPLLERIQALLAAVPTPDYAMLRSYCERLDPKVAGDAVQALEDAARALAMDDVEAYVSRGEKGVGVRAYAGDPPFVLIGGQHLRADSGYGMSSSELRFAIGAELAHVRFGHVRVGPSEVRAGMWIKAKQGIDMALGLVPALRTGTSVADDLVRAAGTWLATAIGYVWQAPGGTRRDGRRRRGEPQSEDVLSTLNEELLVTHRVMQLTADRAGLVVAGDLQAAVRAMLLVRRDYRAELPVMEERGLAQVLSQRSEDGYMAYQDLAVRVSALLRFYLSADYTRLRAAVEG